MKIQCSTVVAQPLPGPENIRGGGRGEGFGCGKRAEKCFEVGKDARHLGLMKHDLGYQDSIRVACSPPGQIPAVVGEPFEHLIPKCLNVLPCWGPYRAPYPSCHLVSLVGRWPRRRSTPDTNARDQTLPSNMPPASKSMFDLQQVETRLEAARAQLHSVDQQLKSSPELERVRSEVERVSKETDGVRASLRRLESQAEDAEDKVKRLTAVLYGGSIHDSREMASMEAEIDHARSRQSELEDQEISLMEQLEGLEARLLAARSRVEELTAGREQSLAPLTKQRGDLE